MWEVPAHRVIPGQVVLGYRRNQAEQTMSPLSYRRWPGMCMSYKPFPFQDALVTVFVTAVGNMKTLLLHVQIKMHGRKAWILRNLCSNPCPADSDSLLELDPVTVSQGPRFPPQQCGTFGRNVRGIFTLHVLIYHHTYIIPKSSCQKSRMFVLSFFLKPSNTNHGPENVNFRGLLSTYGISQWMKNPQLGHKTRVQYLQLSWSTHLLCPNSFLPIHCPSVSPLDFLKAASR